MEIPNARRYDGNDNLGDIFGKGFGQKKEKRKLTVKESYDFLLNEESDKLIDNMSIKRSIDNAEQDGTVFIDEIDKICERIIQALQKLAGKVSKGILLH